MCVYVAASMHACLNTCIQVYMCSCVLIRVQLRKGGEQTVTILLSTG